MSTIPVRDGRALVVLTERGRAVLERNCHGREQQFYAGLQRPRELLHDAKVYQAYDQSEACTYGVFEKQDLRHVMDTVPPGPIVLLGTSLGAAVALQVAALDPRKAGRGIDGEVAQQDVVR